MTNSNGEILWRPAEVRAERSRLAKFMSQVEAHNDIAFQGSYNALHQWSVDDIGLFWEAVWDFCEIIGDNPGPAVEGEGFFKARFFPEASICLAENMLRRTDDAIAIDFYGENQIRQSISFRDLNTRVARIQGGLIAAGIRAGDRVAGYLPNTADAVIAMLAANSLGAIWTGCSPDFGVKGVLDRFSQTKPRILFTCDAYLYNGKKHALRSKVEEIIDCLPSIEQCVVVPYIEAEETIEHERAVLLGEFEDKSRAEPAFTRLPFDHPAFILYSSGTTGMPKCIVHSAGGVLIKHMQEHQLQTDLGNEDVFFYFTTLSWMMWNWLVTGLASGARIVLYDGSPFYPDGNAMFDLIDEAGVTVFGTSAKFLDAVEKAGFEPRRSHKLTSLKSILSTGSVLKPASFDFVYHSIKRDVQLASITGGTDIVGGFCSGNPIGEVRRGELQCITLGMDVQIVDDATTPLFGTPGELICRQPFPTVPVCFWGDDEDQSKFKSAYFEKYPGLWWHGDWATLTGSHGIVVHGRSDTTLNAGGVRIGTSEIYSPVETVPDVAECVVVGQEKDDGDTRLLLFVRLQPGQTMTDELDTELRQRIRKDTTARHVPERIIAVTDIPKTVSGKISETAVRDLVNGRAVKNSEALINCECFVEFSELNYT